MNLESPMPVLEGSRVRLRRAVREDIPDLFALHADRRVMRYWSTPVYTEIGQAQALFERNDRGVEGRDFCYWALALRDGDRLIGSCSLFAINTGNRRAEIGYALHCDHWGRGYALEALGLMIGYAFDTLKLHRIEADVDPRNAGSVRLLERLGFRREGLLRERWQVAGEITDSAIYGLLARDYATAATASAASRATRDNVVT